MCLKVASFKSFLGGGQTFFPPENGYFSGKLKKMPNCSHRTNVVWGFMGTAFRAGQGEKNYTEGDGLNTSALLYVEKI